MRERLKQIGRVLTAAGTVADWVWRGLVLLFGITAAGVIAWLSTTWDWYWSTFDWFGAAVAFVVAYILLAFGTLILAIASAYFRRGASPLLEKDDDGPLIWFANLTLEGVNGPVRALRFHGVNASEREVELRSADITSAINGARISLEVRAVNQAGVNEYVALDRIELVPPGAPIEFAAKFNPPDGLERQAFLDGWGKFFLNVRDDTRTYRQPFNESSIMPFFPGMVGPRIMKKPDPPPTV